MPNLVDCGKLTSRNNNQDTNTKPFETSQDRQITIYQISKVQTVVRVWILSNWNLDIIRLLYLVSWLF